MRAFARRSALTLVLATAVIAALAPSASAQAASIWWGLTTGSRPSSLPTSGQGEIFVTAENLGDTPVDGSVEPVRIVAALPPGLEAQTIKGIAGQGLTSGNRGPVTCALKALECTFASTLPPYEEIEVQIQVRVKPGATSGETVAARVSGGGAAQAATATQPLVIGAPTRFGFEHFALVPESLGGSADTQAGSHPFQLTSVVDFDTQTPDHAGRPRTAALPKNVVAELPPGLVGNVTSFPQCTDAQFATEPSFEVPVIINECPAQSAVGVATVTITEPKSLGFFTITAPIFNMTPRAGEPARFGFKAAGIFSVFLDTAVRTGSDYGVTVTSSDITQVGWSIGAKLSIWGVPGDPSHDDQRGWECLKEFGACPPSSGATPTPLLTMPTSCAAPFQATLRGVSWAFAEHAAEEAEPLTYNLPEAIGGCGGLPFSPSISVTPDQHAASSASGLGVDVHLPLAGLSSPAESTESSVRQITVTLPEGVAVNPSGSGGLEACSESEVGYLPGQSGGESLQFTPEIGGLFCPDAAKIGTVEIKSPLLPPAQPLTGAVYLAAQNANPFGSLIGMYIVASDPISGTVVKQAGEVHLTETGQLISTLRDLPQLPFEDARLHFFDGPRAPLATPARCGAYAAGASFTPWSGSPAVSSTSVPFDIASGPAGGACPGATLPFAPALTAGSTNVQAGAFTSFTSAIDREDGHQALSSVVLHMPPGLSGLLAGVPLCGEAQANEGTCGSASQIGETTVSAGVGSDPVLVTGGRVYITGPYRGAPFGLSIVNPVKAGPFDLENTPQQHPACDCVVVRARIEVDPHTAQLTIDTDSTGPHAIPRVIEGIPVQLKHVNVTITRPGFTFNPTNCNPLTITATITGAEGATQSALAPFHAANCATLKFAPVFKVSTSSKTSKANGASLAVKLSYPTAPFGSEANIKSVKVDLPKQLPSRLTTLQKACLAATFEANPASCPAASIVGHAKVVTPVLPVPLEGPAYFVSHGSEAFPSLTLVLQGYGVTVELVGSTFIHNGVTSSTFKQNPDVPFNTFELTLPQGRYSALAAYGNLCTSKLAMPTLFVAQNGAEKRQTTKIAVTGCRKHHKPARKHKHKHKHH